MKSIVNPSRLTVKRFAQFIAKPKKHRVAPVGMFPTNWPQQTWDASKLAHAFSIRPQSIPRPETLPPDVGLPRAQRAKAPQPGQNRSDARFGPLSDQSSVGPHSGSREADV